MIDQASRRSRQLFDALVGRRSGIVREICLVDTIDGDAPLFHAAARIANAHPEMPEQMTLAGGGSGVTKDGALIAALCEGLERYLGSCDGDTHGALERQCDLASCALPADLFAPFSDQQRQQEGFPYQPVTDHTPLRWTGGRRLSDGERCAVPAFAVYVLYRTAPGEPLVAPGLSTGLSCADSIEAAVLAGACEVIERDSLTLTWLKGMSPRVISHECLMEHAGELLPPADEVAAYDLTSDVGVPIVLVVCRGPGPRGPIISVGSACHPNATRTLRKAALEASQGRVYVRQLLDLDPRWQPRPDFSNVTDFSLHARLYSARPDLSDQAFRFLSANPHTSDLPLRSVPSKVDVSNMLARVNDQLSRRGHDGAWVDLTPDWAAAMRLHVVKVVIPSLMPLHGHHLLPYLGHRRLKEYERAMPNSVSTHGRSIRPWPHPFP